MIKLSDRAPEGEINSVSLFKIRDAFNAYGEAAAVYSNGAGGFIGVSPGGACAATGFSDTKELTAFLEYIRPASVYISGDIARLDLTGYAAYPVTELELCGPAGKTEGQGFDPSSDKVYKILKAVGAFALPPYADFAADYCRRKNRGQLICRALEERAAAIAFVCENAAMINGVASLEKGAGSRVLSALLAALGGKRVFAAAKDETVPFYKKNGFTPAGRAVYYEKNRKET